MPARNPRLIAKKRRCPVKPSAGVPNGAYLDRDLSWLEFNRRVLHEARDRERRSWSASSSWPSIARTSTSSS